MPTHLMFNKILDFKHPLSNGCPPPWASGWGQDAYGPWVEITISSIIQRLRWIPPGQFMMGSPKGEAGRGEHEGPQHPVTISRGYWLFDTPVTQALWEGVMKNNPSEYPSPTRPVENVNWDEARAFIDKLNQKIPGLNLTLSTEAQWEYACRANTETSTYKGELKIVGERNAPLLDEIAWYGGNSGVDFDLKKGDDSSDWHEKQYAHTKAGTRQVAQKRPNLWGLYDILGNVWEWCLDGQRDYQDREETDPVGPSEEGAKRVIRGGSWYNSAHFVRAAYRIAFDPGHRYNYLGFRCARVQEAEKAEPGSGQGSAAERRPDRSEAA